MRAGKVGGETAMGWLFFGFSGRIPRKTYWLASLAVIAYLLVAFAVVAVLFLESGDAFGTLFLPGLLLSVPAVWAGLAIGVKRLHDRDKSGWWVLLFYWLPGVLERMSDRMGEGGGALVLLLLSVAISIWALVEIGFLRGTMGANRFGPDPRGGRPVGAVPLTR
jgi:uncharacterized membrane protein YhaH (DUF805 family)